GRTTSSPTAPSPCGNWLDKKLAQQRLYPPPIVHTTKTAGGKPLGRGLTAVRATPAPRRGSEKLAQAKRVLAQKAIRHWKITERWPLLLPISVVNTGQD